MKKLIIPLTLVIVLFHSCKKELAVREEQSKPSCGTMEAMKNLSPEMKIALSQAGVRAEVQSPSLLLYLDFDGAIVFPGFGNYDRSPIVNSIRVCPPALLTAAMIEELTRLVADDFSPFNITVTTDFEEFISQPAALRQICIISTSPSVIGEPPTTAGVAPFNCTRIFNSPSFVFVSGLQNSLHEVSSMISHEVGHTFGLDHQSLFDQNCQGTPQTEYHPGFGSGVPAFHPIMGKQDNEGLSNWFAQDCPKMCGTPQDDFMKINGEVQLRQDDFPDAPGLVNTAVAGGFDGFLEKQGDVDYVKINFGSPGAVNVRSSGNVDLKVTLMSVGGHVFGEFSDPGSLDVTVPSVAGMRILKIESGGNPNVSSRFLTGGYRVDF